MSKSEENRFDVGEWVVHYFYGVGQVKDIVVKGLGENRQQFYKISTANIDYWLPMDDEQTDHVQPIRSRERFSETLKIMAQAPEKIADHHKSRKTKIQERWRKGSLASRARLLRDLNGRLALEKINFNERQMLENVRSFYIEEWLIADKSITRKTAREAIRDALKTSIKKAKNPPAVSV